MKKEVIYKIVFDNNQLLSQLEWSNFNARNKNRKKFNLFKNQIVHYKDNNEVNLALILEDSNNNVNDVVICPIIPILNTEQINGINIGYIKGLSTINYSYNALIHKIKRIDKANILLDELINIDNLIFINDVITSKLIIHYKHFLNNIINRNMHFEKICVC